MEQKVEKRARTRSYYVVKAYSGRWFTCFHGFCVFIRPPFTDEPRIPLSVGDVVRVTRWRQSVKFYILVNLCEFVVLALDLC